MVQMLGSACAELLENMVGVATPILLPMFCLNIQASMSHLLGTHLFIQILATIRIYSKTPKEFKYTVSWT